MWHFAIGLITLYCNHDGDNHFFGFVPWMHPQLFLLLAIIDVILFLYIIKINFSFIKIKVKIICCLWTGLQHGIIHSPDPYGLPLEIVTLPQRLKEAGEISFTWIYKIIISTHITNCWSNFFLGYSTHMIGKWHLGFYNWESTPTYRGFDTFYGFYSGAEDHYTHVQDHFLDFRDNEEIVRDMNGTYSAIGFTKVSFYSIMFKIVCFTLTKDFYLTSIWNVM